MRNAGAWPVWADFAWLYDYGTLPVLDAPSGAQIPSGLVHLASNWTAWPHKGQVNGDCAWLLPHANRLFVYGCGDSQHVDEEPGTVVSL